MKHMIYLSECNDLLIDPIHFGHPTAKYLFDMEEGDCFYTIENKDWDDDWVLFDADPAYFNKEWMLVNYKDNFDSDIRYFEEEGEIDDFEGWTFQLVKYTLGELDYSEEVVATLKIPNE